MCVQIDDKCESGTGEWKHMLYDLGDGDFCTQIFSLNLKLFGKLFFKVPISIKWPI